MKSIKLRIQNFQSHKDTTLEFGNGLNVIKGTSNHGKSSIMRAIYWLLLNRPSGDTFRNWDDTEGKSTVKVSMFLGDHVVHRVLSKSFNGYVLEYKGEKTEFEALRGAVPKEIQAVLQMDSKNIRMQDEGYFLLQDTPGVRAKTFNKQTGLQEIDKVVKKANEIVKKSKSRLKFKKEEAEKIQDQITAFSGLEQNLDEVSSIVDTIDTIEDTQDKLHHLTSLLHDVHKAQADSQELQSIVKLKDRAQELDKLLNSKNETARGRDRVSKALNDIFVAEETIGKLKKTIEFEEDLNIITTFIQTQNKCKEERAALKDLSSQIKRDVSRVAELKTKQMTDQAELEKLSTFCEMCGSSSQYWNKEVTSWK